MPGNIGRLPFDRPLSRQLGSHGCCLPCAGWRCPAPDMRGFDIGRALHLVLLNAALFPWTGAWLQARGLAATFRCAAALA